MAGSFLECFLTFPSGELVEMDFAQVLPFHELVVKASQKHVGLDPYWLAQACARVREVRVLPRLTTPVALDELRRFFEGEARRLMESGGK